MIESEANNRGNIYGTLVWVYENNKKVRERKKMCFKWARLHELFLYKEVSGHAGGGADDVTGCLEVGTGGLSCFFFFFFTWLLRNVRPEEVVWERAAASNICSTPGCLIEELQGCTDELCKLPSLRAGHTTTVLLYSYLWYITFASDVCNISDSC